MDTKKAKVMEKMASQLSQIKSLAYEKRLEAAKDSSENRKRASEY